MKSIYLIVLVLLVGLSSFAQQLTPVISFNEDPVMHNMHITGDGEYYYTVNGGNSSLGLIQKYDLSGNHLASFDIPIDMRGIFYHPKDKSLYVSSYDMTLYRIKDLASSVYEPVAENFVNGQSAVTTGAKGKYLYWLDDGVLVSVNFPSLEVSDKVYGLKCGEGPVGGQNTVAIDKKHIYTWNTASQQLFVYDLKNGKLLREFTLAKGTYGFSLSIANGLLFVADDGNKATGTWYGYDIKAALK